MERLPASNPLMGIIWYNFAMSMLPVAFAFCMSISAFGVTIPELPQSAFADTEVSTNIAFNSQAFFGTDAAGTHEAYSQPWQDGWKSWPIPMGWGYGIGVLGRFKDYPTFQTYTLSSDGTFRIEKFGHWAERNMLGMVWVDGSLQISSWSW